MKKVRSQIQALHPNASVDEQNKMIFGVARTLALLTVKGLAMDPRAMETVIKAALREESDPHKPRDNVPLLTSSIQDLFDYQRKDLAGSTVDLPGLSKMLAKRDSAARGTNANQEEVSTLAVYLCNKLNSSSPLSTPVLNFVNEVDKSNALGCSPEDWTLNAWKPVFSAYEAQTPKGSDSVIFGLTKLYKASPELAQAARPDVFGLTELAKSPPNEELKKELRRIETSPRGDMVRAVSEGRFDDARKCVLKERDLKSMPTVLVVDWVKKQEDAESKKLEKAGFVEYKATISEPQKQAFIMPDTSELEAAGLSL